MTDEELIALAGKVVERCARVVEQRSAELGARAVDAVRTAAAIRALGGK